jgi:hypothetical protein
MGWHMVHTALAVGVQSLLVYPTGQLAIAEHATHTAAPWADHVLPATHGPHDSMPSVPCAFPASQSAHAVAPAFLLYDPAAHARQAPAAVAPWATLYLPSAHCAHPVLPVVAA